MKNILNIFFTLVVFSTSSWADDASVSARVSANDIPLSGVITLQIDISGTGDVGTPQVVIPDFQVQRAGQTQSYQWVNGQSSSLTSFNFILSPLKTGTLAIPPVRVSVGGKPYSTEMLQVRVRPDGAAGATVPADEGGSSVKVPQEGLKPVFMAALIDNDRPYVGQQILLRVQFLKRPDVSFTSQARFSEADMSGFLVEPLGQQDFTTSLNGATYNVTEIRYALFPTTDGDFSIGSAQIEVAARARAADPFDPNDFFGGFFGRSEVLRLKTKPVPVRVRALPREKPERFSGAVGRYKISARIDSKEVESGKPFNLILTVEGTGNIKTLKEPALPEWRGFRRYETVSTSTLDKDPKQIRGKKEFKVLLIPQVSGTLLIPPVTLNYFDPLAGSFASDSTSEIVLNVKQGAESAEPAPPSGTAAEPVANVEGIRVMERDIRFIKTGALQSKRTPLHTNPFFIILNAAAPLFFLSALIGYWRSRRVLMNPARFRSDQALRKSKKTLGHVKKRLRHPDPVPFYSALQETVIHYLADKFGLSALGLTGEDIERRLKEKNVPAGIIHDVRSILEEADRARYATSSFTDDTRSVMLEKTERVLATLNEVLP